MSKIKWKWSKKGDGDYTDSDSSDEPGVEALQVMGNSSIDSNNSDGSQSIVFTAMDFEADCRSNRIVKTKGWLPFSNDDDFRKFFEDCKFLQSFYSGASLRKVRNTAFMKYYIEFESESDAFRALRKNKMPFGTQYIMADRINEEEMSALVKRCRSNKSFGNAGFICLNCFSSAVSEQEILEFIRDTSYEEFFFHQKPSRCEIYIKLICKNDVFEMIGRKGDEKLNDTPVIMHPIDGVAYETAQMKAIYTVKNSTVSNAQLEGDAKMALLWPINNSLKNPKNGVVGQTLNLSTNSRPKNVHARNYEKFIKPLYETIRLVENTIHRENFIALTHIANLQNYVIMVESKLKSDADRLQNLQKKYEELKKKLTNTDCDDM